MQETLIYKSQYYTAILFTYTNGEHKLMIESSDTPDNNPYHIDLSAGALSKEKPVLVAHVSNFNKLTFDEMITYNQAINVATQAMEKININLSKHFAGVNFTV